jgi:hypothetical protein
MTGKLLLQVCYQSAIPLLLKTHQSGKPQHKTLVPGEGLHIEVCCRENRLMRIEENGRQSVTGPLLLIPSPSERFSAI